MYIQHPQICDTLPMPREKSFDEDAALENAMQLFWQKGYESASISDLLDRMGLNKGSLYNAYGGKPQLFLEALSKYDRDLRHALLAELEALDNPKLAIIRFLDGIVAETLRDQNRKGCFLINTSLDISSHGEEVRCIVTKGLRSIEAFLRRCIEVGQVRDQISSELDPKATAKTLMAICVGIRVLGRGVYDEESLHCLADEGKRLVGLKSLGRGP